jgi:hypothetical protein
MRKFLIVGCGGSGGATLAYMMDQLRSDLAEHGIAKLPAGWQFVHLDVPTAPSPVRGIGTVRDQGGVYVGTGPQSDSYKILDNALSQQLNSHKALGTVATWAPRDPEAVDVPLSEGAGQYRALGRVITLSQAGRVRDELQRRWETLFLPTTDSEMRGLSVPGGGAFEPNAEPIVLVVSSMAGGAGASMALDICRVLTMVPGVDPRKMGVFMVAPDIFDSLSASAVTGVRANALAMLGEIIASQTGAARNHDVALLRALGLDHGEGERTPFARVFPVGRYVGAQRTLFGDGSPQAVYRGLGRGLAALMMSGQATQKFVEWDLTNGAGVAGNRHYLGWGNRKWDNLPWGAFGFASLSMGRDRYKEYAAQRLARSSVDQLLTGHRQADNSASDEEQVTAILDQQWPNICGALGLPTAGSGTVAGWLMGAVLPKATATQYANGIVDSSVRRGMPQGSGVAAAQWTGRVHQVLGDSRDTLLAGAQQVAEVEAFRWQNTFVTRLEAVVTIALGDKGMPYATGLVKRVRRHLQDVVVPSGPDLLQHAPGARIAEVSDDARGLLASLRGVLASTAEVLERVLSGTSAAVQLQIYAQLAQQIGKAAAALTPEVIDPLVGALDESQTVLRRAALAPASESGLAYLQTDEYGAWPSERDEAVAARFAEATNEVMLTSSAQFKARYEVDLPQSVNAGAGRLGLAEGIHRAAAYVITGQWETVTGTRAPGDVQPVVERTTAWRSSVFPRDPETGEALIAQRARYDVHTRPPELLGRARLFAARSGESFDRFCSLSLREFVHGEDGCPESELVGRYHDIATKFAEALSLARPLASVNEKAMQALHDGAKQMEYQYKFSAIPFKEHRVSDSLAEVLRNESRVDKASADAFTAALTDEDLLKRIDIFGSYPNYSPLAYTSVVEQAARQWLAASASQRRAFWTMRRARPLAAALPMHPAERQVAVAGWILGRAIGFIQVPGEPYTEPAYVWSVPDRTWLAFPNPLLTPPTEFLAPYDWLPAVLEGFLLAIAQSHQSPVMASMSPYVALRTIYDDTAEDPLPAGSGMHTLAAKTNLTRFLRGGTSGTGVESVVEGAGPEVSIDERARRVRDYFEQFGTFAGHYYMAPGDGGGPGEPGAPGGGSFSVITVRAQASKTPIFRDIAPDVFWATRQLIGIVDECAEAAKKPERAPAGMTPPPMGTGHDQYAAPQFPGNFEIPKGGNF